MAAITWAHVVDHAAELSTVDTDAQTDILDFVNNEGVDPAIFHDGSDSSQTYRLARIALAAHIATMGKRRGTGGAVTSQSAGQLSRSYGVNGSAATDLDATSYGQLFKGYVHRSAARAPFAL